MKKRLFSLSHTHSSKRNVGNFHHKKIGSGTKFSIRKPGRQLLIFMVSCIFLLVCIALAAFPSILPTFGSSNEKILAPNASIQSLSVFNTQLKSKNIQFDTMSVATESPTVVVYLSNGAYAYLDLHTNAKAQADLLSLILSRIASDNQPKKLKYVDLRYDKPVVKY